MRTILLAGALLGLVACGRRQPATAEPAVQLPPRSSAPVLAPASEESIVISVTADGRILARGRARSLAGLDELLGQIVRRRGDSPYATTAARLRIDCAAPWLHVRWLVATLASHGVHEVRFVYADPACGEADVPCSARPAAIICGLLASPPDTPLLHVRIRMGPSGQVRCGPLDARDPVAVRRWSTRWKKTVNEAGLAGIRGEIAAEDATPWGAVAEVNALLRACGAKNVVFAGGYVGAPADVREASRLPAPAGGGRGRSVAAKAWGQDREDGGVEAWRDWPTATEFTAEWPDENDFELPLEEPEPPIEGR